MRTAQTPRNLPWINDFPGDDGVPEPVMRLVHFHRHGLRWSRMDGTAMKNVMPLLFAMIPLAAMIGACVSCP